MSVVLEFDTMSVEDKFLTLEKLWESMIKDTSEKEFSPDWHLDVLREREERILSGETGFHSIENVKARLHKHLK